jgi:hypothetical protein
MDIKISFTLSMNDDNLKDWALEYGLDMSEVSSDATNHLGELVREHVKAIQHVEEFASLKNFRVQ